MAELREILRYLTELLTPADFEDASFNGLQVESPSQDIRKVATAVDSGLSIIERATAAKSQLLIVHHGLLWGGVMPIAGTYGKKVNLLLSSGCSLYASHLPLDAHRVVGNNALLAQHFELTLEGGFAEANGKFIGVLARTKSLLTREHFTQQARQLTGCTDALMLPFGPEKISTVGILSGSGAFAIHAAAAQGIDLLISGEPKQQVYHEAKELGVNALFAGHYATETLGVRALGRLLHERFGIEHLFIDEPTGI